MFLLSALPQLSEEIAPSSDKEFIRIKFETDEKDLRLRTEGGDGGTLIFWFTETTRYSV